MKKLFGAWLNDIRWGDLLMFVIAGGITAGLGAFQEGASPKSITNAAIIGSVSVVAAFLRNPKNLNWEKGGKEDGE